jgi:hypothetical protein
MKTLHLIPHPACLPARVRAVTARVLSHDGRWCVLRWKVAGTADLVVPAFAGRARQDGLWQTTCFELFVTSKALPPEGEGWAGVCDANGEHNPSDAGHPSPTSPLRGGAKGYTEFNFSPSERWAAYDFTAYRTGIADRPITRPPVITPRRGGDVLFCDVAIPVETLPPFPWHYGLTAVLEEVGNVKSYWAIAHPPERPDFHDPACLGAWLAAPDEA